MSSGFTVFRLLPTEIRLKIWRLTLPSRIVYASLDKYSPETGLWSQRVSRTIVINAAPRVRHSLPVALHVCRESRDEALSLYQPCAGTNWRSPHAYPYNLWNPERDVLFIPMEFPPNRAATPGLVPGPMPYLTLATPDQGFPRWFILDQLAAQNPSDVAAIRRLAVFWANLYIRGVSNLASALEPFTALEELSIVFYDVGRKGEDVSSGEGHWIAKLKKWDGGGEMGHYISQKLCEMVDLAKAFNERFREAGVEGRKRPEINVKAIVFER